MNRKIRHIFCVLLCLAMALSLTGTALAYDGSGEEQAIAIRITPPSGWAEQRAEVEVRLTDNAGTGFQSAQVQTDGGSWQDITGALEQTENRWYTVVELTENCTVYVRVTGRDGTIYEKSQFVRCFDSANDYQNPVPSTPGGTNASVTPSPAPQPSAGLATPPGGQGTVIDNASGTAAESGREFFTIATPDENVFYLVIDRQRDSENVYFLNAVTESDLMALAQKDAEGPSQSAVPDPAPVCSCTQKCVPGAVNAACPVCVLSWQDCTATAEAPGQTDPEPEKPQEKPQEGRETLVYVGPSLPRGMLKQNSIFVGTREEVEKSLEEAMKKYPMAKNMLVPVSKLAEAKVKIASKGNILHKYYADIVSLIGAEFKE